MRNSEKRKYHIIYKTTCVLTGKYYIGLHSTYNLDDGYQGSGKILKASVAKHGAENHKVEIIECWFDRSSLVEREAQLVTSELVQDENCMNLKLGGDSGWPNILLNADSDRQRLKNKLSQVKQEWLRENDPEWVEAVKASRSKALAKSHAEGKRPPPPNTKGLVHTEETKRAIGDKNKVNSLGSNNSQYGTMWLFSDTEKRSIKVREDKVAELLLNGWQKGRKLKFDHS